MRHQSKDEAALVLGWMGAVATLPLFLAPLEPMRRISQRKAVGSFSIIPYAAAWLNCSLWVAYALPWVSPGRLQSLSINLIGLLLESSYLLFYLRCAQCTCECDDKYAGQYRERAILGLAIMAAVLATFLSLVFVFAPRLPIASWPDKDESRLGTVLGFACVLFNTVMYGSPLAVILEVFRTRSVDAMPLSLSVGVTICSAFWAAYALYLSPPDFFILAPNVTGVLLSALQLLIYARFSACSSAKRSEALLPASGDITPSRPPQLGADQLLLADPRSNFTDQLHAPRPEVPELS
eukprot:6183211-Pleurochrysis_carterae.AAC.2